MLVRIMEALESVPEASGSMMDHTLIVYTSNNADKQHTNGANWPVMLLGNFDGAFKTGCFTQLDGKRPINAFYATLLRAAGLRPLLGDHPTRGHLPDLEAAGHLPQRAGHRRHHARAASDPGER